MKRAQQQYRIEYMHNLIAKRLGDYVITLYSEETLTEEEMDVIDKVLGETLTIGAQLEGRE